MATGARTATTVARAGFTLAKLLTILAVVGGVAAAATAFVVLHHHHLAQGYLYQAPGNSGLAYFHIEESFGGGDVSGTFSTPILLSCQDGGQIHDVSENFTGTVSDTQLMMTSTFLGFTVFQLTFTRQGDDMDLQSANLFGVQFSLADGSVFKPSDDAGYNTEKQALAQAACSGQ